MNIKEDGTVIEVEKQVDLKDLPDLAGKPRAADPATQWTNEDPNLEAFIRARMAADKGDLYGETHRQVDRLLLSRVLGDAGGNQQQAARWLGISRETLRRRLRELGLQVTRQLEAEGDDQP
jgi:two-component system nitrogen regulation response regulator GlnG